MKSSAYCTFDEIHQNSGAGKVCLCETKALQNISDLKCVVSKSEELRGFPLKTLNLEKWYPFNPYLYDYFASRLIPQNLDLLHLSCSPGLAILDHCKPRKYVVNIVAHDLNISIQEHEKYYGVGTYPFAHNIDQYLHKLLLEHAENADCVITPSTSSANWINDNIPNRKQICIIPHGTDIPEEKDIKSIPGKLIVGYLGAFGPDKGLPYLLLAWKHFDYDASELVFAGNCTKVLENPDISNFFGISSIKRVRMLGWVNDVKDFYNQISVYVQPSVTEGFGIEILEAMSYGRPVIASKGAGGADVITHGVDGFVVSPGDPGTIFEILHFFKDHPDQIIEMGRKAIYTASKYSWDKIQKQYEQLYTELLK